MTVTTTCPMCHKNHEIRVPVDGYFAWKSGELIQKAMPKLSIDEREMLISGICPTCWDTMFGADEEDEGDDIYVCERESLGNNWW